MTERIPEPESQFEEEGIPDPGDATPEQEATGDTAYGLEVPRDHAIAADDYGTTQREESLGEPLDIRVGREEPDVLTDEAVARSPEGDDLDTPFHDPESVGVLVEDDEGVRGDETAEAVAHEVPSGGSESAEEAAMHMAAEEG